jgi:hypothetical protein
MDQAPAPVLARGAGEQKPAKRPETKKGGREEEEFRLGIASATEGRRLRSAKIAVFDGADPSAVMTFWRRGNAEKFRGRWDMSLSDAVGGLPGVTFKPMVFEITDQLYYDQSVAK